MSEPQKCQHEEKTFIGGESTCPECYRIVEHWRCGKCDQEIVGRGEPIPEHFRSCPKRPPVEKNEETPLHCKFEGCACKVIAHPSVPCPRTTPLNTSWEDSFDETDFGFVMNANPKRNLKDFIRSLLASETTKARQQAREAFAEETIEFIKLKLDAKD